MLNRFGVVLVIAALLGLWTQGRGDAALPGGTQITNSVSATYQDASQQSFSVLSNVVIATIANVAAIEVTPKQAAANAATDGVQASSNGTRTFVISNTSNIPDAYKITALTCAPLTLVSASFVTPTGSIPVTVGETASPTIPAGGTIELQVVVSTNTLKVGDSASINVTAQTTVEDVQNGLQSDTGEQWVIVSTAPAVNGGSGPASRIGKTVNQQQATQADPGGTVTYDVTVANTGGAPANNVVVTDTIQEGLTIDVTTVAVNGVAAGSNATLDGQVLTIKPGNLDAGGSWDISFKAVTSTAQQLGATYTNVASLTVDNGAPIATTPAAVLVGQADVVYDGDAGATAPVPAAVVTLLDANGNPVVLSGPSSQGSAAQSTSGVRRTLESNTSNPFTTGSTGGYGFSLQPSQIAPGGSQFYMTISAPGYLNRKIGLFITPGLQGLLYNVTVTSQDGQPTAVAGGFSLTTSAVQLGDIYGLFGNIPLFAQRTISVSKTADRTTAEAGDRIKYEVDFSNASTLGVGPIQVVDSLPAGEVYASGTARVDATDVEPSIDGRSLTWSFPSLNPGASHVITYDAIVYPTVVPGTNLENGVTVSGNVPGTHVTASGNSNVTVQVITGAFTQRRVITGRVFYDVAKTGRFARGDRGIAGVRIFLEDGSSVVTDNQGRYSFPSVRPGEHVLRLDTTTLPKDARPSDGAPMNSNYGMQRLVHGIFDDGLMDDVEFALEPQ